MLVRGLCLILILLASPVFAGDWPQWRGPHRNGVWAQEDLPDTLSRDTLKVRWKRSIGGGYGGIAATGGRIYVMDRLKSPRDVERVLCLNAQDGAEIWCHEYPVNYGKLDYGNGPRATPTVHEGRVYTLGSLGHLHCLDAASGKLLWHKETAQEFQGRLPTWGHACSPLVNGERLILQVGGQPDACLVALDRISGKLLWKALPDRPGYSSPVLMTVAGKSRLLYWAAESLNGLDPGTGRVIWRVPHTTNYDVTISDPVYHQDVVLVSDYWTGSRAIRVAEGEATPKILWEGKKPLSMLMATPLVGEGVVYALDRYQGLKCLEMATGTVRWEEPDVTPRGTNPHMSMVWAGSRGKVVIVNSRGELILARMTPERYQLLGKVKILGDTWAHPGFMDGAVFARNDSEIVCVSFK